MNTPENLTEKLYQINHDLKNPLSGIKLTIDLMLDEKIGPISDMQRKLLKNAQNDCKKMEQLLKDFIAEK